jgi:hypothetical protein
MIQPKWLMAIAIGTAVLGTVVADVAHAQEQSTSRKKVKVRTRSFNPFAVSQSQLTVDRFGIVRFADAAKTPPLLAAPNSIEKKSADVATSAGSLVMAATSPVTAAAITSASLASAAVATSTDSVQATDVVLNTALRPPGGRPPLRSEFRPLSRAPF